MSQSGLRHCFGKDPRFEQHFRLTRNMGRLAFGISQSSNSGNNFESCFEVFFYFSKNLFFSNS